MKKKIIPMFIIILIIMSVITSTIVYASTDDVTLEKAEDNVCTIDLGTDGKLTKKLISVDNTKKEVTLQVDVTNLKTTETEIEPSEVMLVIDKSASMAKNTLSDKTTTRKEAVFSAAKTLATNILKAQSKTKIGVVSFSTVKDATTATIGTLDDAKLEISPTSTLSSITSAIDGIETAGDLTDIDAGLQVAKNSFDTDTTLNKYLILLTDGVPNTVIGGQAGTYSGNSKTKTKETLQSVVDSNINIVTVMTGVNSTYQPDPDGQISSEAKGKTYQALAEEVFGTQSKPNYGKFYYVTDDNVANTITTSVYSDVQKTVENSIKDITIVDYFPDDIIANYDFSIVEEANIGTVTASVDTTNNSITWTISKLNAGETASFKYKLKLKDSYSTSILNQIMPTNKKVDVTYTGTDGTKKTNTSDVSPKIVLKGKTITPVTPVVENKTGDNTVATTIIPKTGENTFIIVTGIVVLMGVITVCYYKSKKIK